MAWVTSLIAGSVIGGSLTLCCIPVWYLIYGLGLSLRSYVGNLPPAHLSSFLCRTVLLGGMRAFAPMIFFTLESVSCMSSKGIGDDACDNTNHAAMILSCYLVLFAATSIAG